MKPTQNHNTNRKQVKAFNFKNIAIMSLIALNTFGHKTLNFFDKLLTIGNDPYSGLTKGQLKRMYWLRYVAG